MNDNKSSNIGMLVVIVLVILASIFLYQFRHKTPESTTTTTNSVQVEGAEKNTPATPAEQGKQ
jgi:hypothetical protein